MKKIALIGKLPKESTVVILTITEVNKSNPLEIVKRLHEIVDEYSDAYPEIKIGAVAGDFKRPISEAKAKALCNLLNTLNAPMQKLMGSINAPMQKLMGSIADLPIRN